MKDTHTAPEENEDAAWQLLGEAPPSQASGRFVDDTVRSAKLLAENEPAWCGFWLPPWTVAAALLALGFLLFFQTPEAEVEPLAADPAATWVEIEEFAEVAMLEAAVDHLDEFSDQELVTLIGF